MCHLTQHFGASLPLQRFNIMDYYTQLSIICWFSRREESVLFSMYTLEILVVGVGGGGGGGGYNTRGGWFLPGVVSERFTEELLVSSHDLNELWLPSLVHPPGRHLPGAAGLHTARFSVQDRRPLFPYRSTQLLVSVHPLCWCRGQRSWLWRHTRGAIFKNLIT